MNSIKRISLLIPLATIVVAAATTNGCTSAFNVKTQSKAADCSSQNAQAKLANDCSSSSLTATLKPHSEGVVTSDVFEIVATFSSEIQEFDLTKVVVSGGTASSYVISGSKVTLTIVAMTLGEIAVYLPEGVATDIQGHKNLVSNEIKVNYEDVSVMESPTVSVTSGFYTSAKTIVLSSSTQSAAIYYSLDGSTPTAASNLYSAPFVLNGSKTLKAIAIKTNGRSSSVSTFSYQILMRLVPNTTAANDGTSMSAVELTNGNIVVAQPYADIGGVADVGMVNLFNGTTGQLISTLVGSTASDRVGQSIKALTNGNFVVRSTNWDCNVSLGCSETVTNAGAVTWVNGNTGLNATVSASNSLIGSIASDLVGSLAVIALNNGNYVVVSPWWDCTVAGGCSSAITDVGAVTWGNGSTGISGPVTSANSLVGSTAYDYAGIAMGTIGVVALTNGNYVVATTDWSCQLSLGCSTSNNTVGAVTWANGLTGISGPISSSNSLIGSSILDQVGGSYGLGVTPLANGNYVIASPYWNCTTGLSCAANLSDAGAVTWVNGATGASGQINATNSLVGTSQDDRVGYSEFVYSGVVALTNGNYVVQSMYWDCKTTQGCTANVTDVGAATWASGSSAITGTLSATNSLVGSTSGDLIGHDVIALSNGNYVATSGDWDCKATLGCGGAVVNVGAVTFGNGTTGVSGVVSSSNSLLGTTASDFVGKVGTTKALTNGHYVVGSDDWDCHTSRGCASNVVDVGAVTWGNGVSGTTGFVSASNSLIGSTTGDAVGNVTALTNGNYVVRSVGWNCTAALGCSGAITDVGAITWRSGAAASSAVVSATNSLVGSTDSDMLGTNLIALTNGNYLVASTSFDCTTNSGCEGTITNAGAVTWGNGSSGTTGTISVSNSFVGMSANDEIGNFQLTALLNGNFAFGSSNFDCVVAAGCSSSIANVGAVTWGDGAIGSAGRLSTANSVVGGTSNDAFGTKITRLSGGGFIATTSMRSTPAMASVGCSFKADGLSPIAGIIAASE